ncbi:hypothetical protein [Nitrososphaera sp. AFS]|jgi:hypothetical protein|uniref:hypothetical protein n=1 Tax=Nitrososphaera sp. AFS TaxID=2301191 RepID=UPI0013924273|nr:hypothetical protein [Nitrososphaera sp. AFS]NAL78305.1 hypothetical protein [Nitrososphaera sp. AFS]
MNSFHSLKNRLSLDVVKMVDKGAARDGIMIRVGMLLMLDQLDYGRELSQASRPHEDGRGSKNTNRIQIRPIFENAAVTSLYN